MQKKQIQEKFASQNASFKKVVWLCACGKNDTKTYILGMQQFVSRRWCKCLAGWNLLKRKTIAFLADSFAEAFQNSNIQSVGLSNNEYFALNEVDVTKEIQQIRVWCFPLTVTVGVLPRKDLLA